MKSKFLKVSLVLVSVSALVAWSPPPPDDDIVMGSNTVGTPSGNAIVVGLNNKLKGNAVIVSGNNNSMAENGTNSATSLRYSIVAGTGHAIAQNCESNFVTGNGNTLDANYSFIAGHANTIRSTTVGSHTFRSAAIGWNNMVSGGSGWAIGHQNTVEGNRGTALGVGNEVSNTNSVAIGNFNEEMAPDDLIVLGSGTGEHGRRSSLKVKSDGGVVIGDAATGSVLLARPQGDISMGEYSY